ncbi:MAG TPA: VTT domain-containing protein, partial [Candidatus Kapabacteria bacterium]|nr:VTT domain-containing protein [Candidatus Kapabacteria bacterium]
AGALTATTGALEINTLFIIISIAAVAGDTANYWIGKKIGPKVFNENIRFLKREYLERTHKFYEKHGGKTIIIARFVPIVRTFAPFVAGIGEMNYLKFITYNIVGGIAWSAIFLYTGYFFSDNEFIKNNFSIVAIAIVFISVVPIIIEFIKSRILKKNNLVVNED